MARILIVEDESIMALDLESTLNSMGHEVVHVASKGEDAVEKAKELNPDIVLMDIILKGDMTGIEAAQEIKKLRIPLLYLTAHSEESMVDKALETEPYGYLLKPYDFTELKYTIELALNKHYMDQQLRLSERKYRNLFDHMDNGVVVLESSEDDDFILKDINNAGAKIDKIVQKEVIGKKLTEVFPSVVDNGLLEVIRRVRKTGVSEKYLVSYYEDGEITGWRENFVYKLPTGEVVSVYSDVTSQKRLEKALRESEEKYRRLTESSPDMIYRMALPSGRYEYVNPAVEPLTGYSPQDLYENPDLFKQIVHPQWKDYIEKQWDNLLQGIIPEYYEYKIITKSGHEKWLNQRNNVIRDDQGRILAIEAIVTDVTSIKESEERYRILVDSLNEAVYQVDVQGNIRYISASITKMSGFTPKELIGNNYRRYIHPEDIQGVQERFQRILQGCLESFEFRIKTKNGNYLTVSSSNSPLYEEGELKGLSGVLSNISELKRAEKIIEEEKDKLQRILDALPFGVYIVDQNYNLTYVNPVILRKFGPVKDRKCYEYLHNKREKCDFCKNLLVFKGETVKWQWKSPENRIFELYDIPLKNSDGALSKLEIVNDITDRERAYSELEKIKELYNIITENTEDVIWIMNLASHKITYISPSVERMLGYTVEETLSKTIKDILTPKCYEKVVKNIKSRVSDFLAGDEKVKVKTYFLELVHSNGEIIPVESVTRLIVDENGDLSEILGVSRDITERIKVQDAYEKEMERFRALIYNSTDLIRILDQEGKIIFDSPSSTRLLGYPEGSLVGHSPLEFIHPDDRLRVEKDLQEVYENKNPGTPTEFRIRKANGSYLPVETVAINLSHIPGIEGIVVTTHPIKERKEMEKALRKSEEKYRTLFQVDPDYMLLLSVDGIIEEVNQAAINFLGLDRDQIIGKYFMELYPFFAEDVLQKHLSKYPLLLQGEEVGPFEIKLRNKDNETCYIDVKINPIFKEDEVINILVIATDITFQKLAEEDMKNSLKEKEILLQELHHRVKNNMQIISSLLNLQTLYVEGEETQNVLQESQNRVRSMAMIHEKLYQAEDLSRVNFLEYLQGIVSDLYYSYKQDPNQIQPIIRVDKDIYLNIETAVPCGLIITELVSNSLKYAFPDNRRGHIRIDLSKENDFLSLKVSDDGIGLSSSVDLKATRTLGWKLVDYLSKQLESEVSITNTPGICFQFKFKELEYKKRN